MGLCGVIVSVDVFWLCKGFFCCCLVVVVYSVCRFIGIVLGCGG